MYDELVKALRGCVVSKPCDGCPYYDPNGPTEKCATMNIAAADAIEELYAINQRQLLEIAVLMTKPRWIPVTERLPEEYTTILFVSGSGQVHVGYYDGEHKGFCDMTGFRYMCTHWMLAPEPPKEET